MSKSRGENSIFENLAQKILVNLIPIATKAKENFSMKGPKEAYKLKNLFLKIIDFNL